MTPMNATFSSLPEVRGGDSLSGFIARFGSLHGLNQRLALASLGWPDVQGSASILDVLRPAPEVEERISQRAGLTSAQITAMTLEDVPAYTSATGRLRALSLTHGRGKAFQKTWRSLRWTYAGATPFCTECLAERPGAHQLKWRFGLVPLCLEHGLTLVSQCPRCGELPFDPNRWSRDASGGTNAQRTCACGFPLEGMDQHQHSANAEQIAAARQALAWITDPCGSASLLDACQRWVVTLAGELLEGQHPAAPDNDHQLNADVARLSPGAGKRLRTHRPPGAYLLAWLLPEAVSLSEFGPLPATLNRKTNVVLLTRAAIALTESGVTDGKLSAAIHKNRRSRSWRGYVPALRRPHDLHQEHVPQLFPRQHLPSQLSDLMYDAFTIIDQATRQRRSVPTLNTVRRAVSVAACMALWQQSMNASQRQLNVPYSVHRHLKRVMDGLVQLDRIDEFRDGIGEACRRLIDGPRIDYEWRTMQIEDPRAYLLLAEAGLEAESAELWLLEEYACGDPARLRWTRRSTERHRLATDLGADFARLLDSKLRPTSRTGVA